MATRYLEPTRKHADYVTDATTQQTIQQPARRNSEVLQVDHLLEVQYVFEGTCPLGDGGAADQGSSTSPRICDNRLSRAEVSTTVGPSMVCPTSIGFALKLPR